MTQAPPTLSAAAREYYRLLLDLDDLFASGRGESDEAEVIRDQMDGPWHRMTVAEQQLMRRLSADLNDIGPDRPAFVPMSKQELTEYEARKKTAYEALVRENYELPSQFLRENHPAGTSFAPATIRFMQARLWLRAGLPEAALRFFREAERTDSEYAVFTMNLLRDLGRHREAVGHADRLLERCSNAPIAVYFSCATLLEQTRHAEPAEVRSVVRRVVDHLRRIFNMVEADQSYQRNALWLVIAIGDTLALCLDALDETDAAVRICERLLALSPNDRELWTTYGTVLHGKDRRKSIQAFERAIQLRTEFVWAYVFYAQAVVEREPLKALKVCNTALWVLRDIPDKASAALYHLRAIAQAEIGQPLPRVLEDFDRALDFDPDDEVIRENRQLATSALPRLTAKGTFRTGTLSQRVVEQVRIQTADRQSRIAQQRYAESHSPELLVTG